MHPCRRVSPSFGQDLLFLPRGLAARGAVLGLACLVAVGIPATGLLGALGIATMPFARFVTFKALFAAALAIVVTPFIARAALADAR